MSYQGFLCLLVSREEFGIFLNEGLSPNYELAQLEAGEGLDDFLNLINIIMGLQEFIKIPGPQPLPTVNGVGLGFFREDAVQKFGKVVRNPSLRNLATVDGGNGVTKVDGTYLVLDVVKAATRLSGLICY